MTINYTPCVINGGAVFWLPLPITKFDDSPTFEHEADRIPGPLGGYVVLWTAPGPTEINIQGNIYGYGTGQDGKYDINSARKAENAENVQKVMQGATSGGAIAAESPFFGTFSLFRWHDRAYLNCVCKSMSFSKSNNRITIPYSLSIVSYGGYLDFTNAIGDQSDWQHFIGRLGQ
jgi:hypothetical protein